MTHEIGRKGQKFQRGEIWFYKQELLFVVMNDDVVDNIENNILILGCRDGFRVKPGFLTWWPREFSIVWAHDMQKIC